MDFCIFTKVEVNIKHLSHLLSTSFFEGLSLNQESDSLTTLAMSKTQASFSLWLSHSGIRGTHCCAWFFTWVMGVEFMSLHVYSKCFITESSPQSHWVFYLFALLFFAWDQTDLKIAKGDFKLMTSLPLPPKCLDYRYESLSLKNQFSLSGFYFALFILNTLAGEPTPSPYLSSHVYLL